MSKAAFHTYISIFIVIIMGVVSSSDCRPPSGGPTPHSVPHIAPTTSEPNVEGIILWKNGIVPYMFDDKDSNFGPKNENGDVIPVTGDDKTRIEEQMKVWEDALKTKDPVTGEDVLNIDFVHCLNNRCKQRYENYLLIRYNILNPDGTEHECNNMPIPQPGGMEMKVDGSTEKAEDGITELHFMRGEAPCNQKIGSDKPTSQPSRIILHELGHVLGLWHSFNRGDSDRWLLEFPDLDGKKFSTTFGTKENMVPVLGNYDYDSIMSYGSNWLAKAENELVFTDYHGNFIDKPRQGTQVSPRDVSWILQFYARLVSPYWGFWQSLSRPPEDPDKLPDPYLARGVKAVGTPAIAYQGSGKYEIFARGSDKHIYWYKLRFTHGRINYVSWQSIGCCFSSDPSAVSRGNNRIDVVAISVSGEVMLIRYVNGDWREPLSIRNGPPANGVKQFTSEEYIAPEITSRSTNSLDVFVVRSDGRLSVSTWEDENWKPWYTLGNDYNVSTRPAAVKLSTTIVQIAINENNEHLYEPTVIFNASNITFVLGEPTAKIDPNTSPAITSRSSDVYPYRVLIIFNGQIFHRADKTWEAIGGIPLGSTSLSAVDTGNKKFMAVMNGEDATGCYLSCCHHISFKDTFIQPGGLWIRDFQ